MAHASGYVGEVSEQQIEASNGRFRPGDFVGKSAWSANTHLCKAATGMRRVVVNSVGKEVDHLRRRKASLASRFSSPSIPTCSRSASNAGAARRRGCRVDPRSGEILASLPSFE